MCGNKMSEELGDAPRFGNGLGPEELRRYLWDHGPVGEECVPFPLFHGTDRNVLEIDPSDIPLFQEKLWFVAETLYWMVRSYPWRYSKVLYPHDDGPWDLLEWDRSLGHEDLKEVMEWIMPDLLKGKREHALWLTSLDEAFIYAPLASYFGMVGRCAHVLSCVAQVLFDESYFSKELKEAMAFVDVFEKSPSRPVVVMFWGLERSFLAHEDGSVVGPSEYPILFTDRECNWMYTAPLSPGKGVEVDVNSENKEEFDAVLKEFFSDPSSRPAA